MWKSESTPEFSRASFWRKFSKQKELLELNLSKHSKYDTYFTPLSENTSPLHMTRVRPVWDNLCTKRGGCPFSHYNQVNQNQSSQRYKLTLVTSLVPESYQVNNISKHYNDVSTHSSLRLEGIPWLDFHHLNFNFNLYILFRCELNEPDTHIE